VPLTATTMAKVAYYLFIILARFHAKAVGSVNIVSGLGIYSTDFGTQRICFL
jgi:hypothetical protein